MVIPRYIRIYGDNRADPLGISWGYLRYIRDNSFVYSLDVNTCNNPIGYSRIDDEK